jgi:4-aminobutyrate aminotransferase-like enzyme
VDPDLVTWAKQVADHLETKATIVTQLNDPATLRQARENAAAGQTNPMVALEQSVAAWERNRERLRAEGQALQQTLSQRHARTFPSPQL